MPQLQVDRPDANFIEFRKFAYSKASGRFFPTVGGLLSSIHALDFSAKVA
jgi:hypothetical protein